jgi:hypothetical protein
MNRVFVGKRSFERLLSSFFKSAKGARLTNACRLRANALARRRVGSLS